MKLNGSFCPPPVRLVSMVSQLLQWRVIPGKGLQRCGFCLVLQLGHWNVPSFFQWGFLYMSHFSWLGSSLKCLMASSMSVSGFFLGFMIVIDNSMRS